ncbi:MAG: hypothetical protein SAJ37_19130, partial [Oscillatoria sp. PMC 1068.18]|nr:hypothetical protein [Oscillatoria sp. PMC 1068.18]
MQLIKRNLNQLTISHHYKDFLWLVCPIIFVILGISLLPNYEISIKCDRDLSSDSNQQEFINKECCITGTLSGLRIEYNKEEDITYIKMPQAQSMFFDTNNLQNFSLEKVASSDLKPEYKLIITEQDGEEKVFDINGENLTSEQGEFLMRKISEFTKNDTPEIRSSYVPFFSNDSRRFIVIELLVSLVIVLL